MANGDIIAIDANLPLEPYINLCMAPDKTVRTWHLESHARKVRERMREMAGRIYQSQFDTQPVLTLLLVANDHYISTALETDETLIADGIKENVVLGTPSDILTLLQTISINWREQAFTKDAQNIRATGLNMYKRFGVFAQLLAQLGSELSGVLHSYNKAVTFFEGSDEEERPQAKEKTTQSSAEQPRKSA